MSGRMCTGRSATGVNGFDAKAVHSETTYYQAGSGRRGCYDRHNDKKNNAGGWAGYGLAGFLIAWIVLTIIIFFIFYCGRFTFCCGRDSAGDCTDTVDCGKALLWSIFIALIILIIFWAIFAAIAGTAMNQWKR